MYIQTRRRQQKLAAILVCIAVLTGFLMPLLSMLEKPLPVKAETQAVPELKTFDDLTGKTVAMLTAAPFEELVREKNPDVGSIEYFANPSELILALKSGRIDAFLANNAAAAMMVNQDKALAVFPEPLLETSFGYMFPEGDAEREKWQAAYDTIGRERVDELWRIWTGDDESAKILPEQDWAGANGTVRVAACDCVPPLCYAGKNGVITGFDIALMLEIAKVLDVHLDFAGMDFSAVMAEIQSGKAQVGCASVVISEEREKLMDFMPYHEASYVMVVRAEQHELPGADPECKTYSDLNGKVVSMLTGAPFEELVRSKAPGVKDVVYFSSVADAQFALENGKVDAFLNNNAVATMMVNQDSGLAMFPESLGDTFYGFAFKKGDKLCQEWQAAYDSIGAERIEELWEIWTGADESLKVLPDQNEWDGANGTIRVAACDALPPMSYVGNNGDLMGFDIAVELEIAKKLNVHLDFTGMEFSTIMAEVQSGKAQVGNGSIVTSEERKKLVDFVQYHAASVCLVVRSEKGSTANAPAPVSEYASFGDLKGKHFGLIVGSPFAEIIESKVPEVGEYSYFTSIPDMTMALKAGKIDAFLTGDVIEEMLLAQEEGIAVFPESFGQINYGIAFPKDDPKTAQWQEACDRIGSEHIEELVHIFSGKDESRKRVLTQDWEGKNGTLRVASGDAVPPLTYAGKDGELTGMEIALLLEMAKELDVHLEFTGMELSALLTSLETGKADIGNSGLGITKDRLEKMDFVKYRTGSYVLVTRSASERAVGGTFIDSIKESFERTFITDGRYKMIFLGLLRTIIMAVFAGVLGTLVGFALVFLRQLNNRIINKLISVYSSLITGIPVVVILMVMYYIVFGKLDAPALLVAIIGFTVIFGARAYGLIQNAVNAVDPGQREAALALGYSEHLAFRKVVLPQAYSIYFPPLKTQLVMLLKETSVAGYITVLEMTRAVDLVRSRTMEAFFPLITAAIIYYVLTWVMMKLISYAEKKYDKKHEERKIKGVD